jgi:hypothetical protein
MAEKRGSRKGLRKVRWGFDDGPDFDGWTDDTTWNGWLNVWVTPETHQKVIAWLRRSEREQPGSAADTITEMVAMTPDLRGLISYAYGYTTQEVA